MTSKAIELDAGFIEKQREVLIRLRQSLLAVAKAAEAEEADIKAESGGPREYEDDAQMLATLEVDANLVVRDMERLAHVDRALRKIEEGTYGFSDVSGDPIPRERLEAVPEAIFTVDEERAMERRLAS